VAADARGTGARLRIVSAPASSLRLRARLSVALTGGAHSVGFYFRDRDRLDRFDDDDVRQSAWWSVLAGA